MKLYHAQPAPPEGILRGIAFLLRPGPVLSAGFRRILEFSGRSDTTACAPTSRGVRCPGFGEPGDSLAQKFLRTRQTFVSLQGYVTGPVHPQAQHPIIDDPDRVDDDYVVPHQRVNSATDAMGRMIRRRRKPL
ncbi:Uncharacterized protein PBTT_09434 [Plasmodiophora brassicae]|uniref:Uncharacterized protein n=1 Tax=Plasmodiophora brassicae TaxID=37360 RepID=A0A0G4J0P4_PLABS|nr:hypothetical protein PBRA_008241 [Plasmodiophora brassicae]SPR01236.1 unnamed protein product [Plasmodiophora brassicae]